MDTKFFKFTLNILASSNSCEQSEDGRDIMLQLNYDSSVHSNLVQVIKT